MSRVIGLPSAAAWTSRALHFSLAIVLRRLLALGLVALALVWLVCIGVLTHDMVSWWAEFAVTPLWTASAGPPSAW